MSPSKQIWGTNGPDMQTEEGRYILHLDGCVQRRRLTSLPVNLAHQLSPATTTPAEPTMAAKAFRGGGSGTTASRSVRPSIRRWGSRRDARNLALAPNLPPPHPPGKQEPEERDGDQSMDDTWLLLLLLRQYQPVTFSH